MVKNIYGFSKVAAEDLCQLFARQTSINTVVLRLTRFFAEPYDSESVRCCFADANAKDNEFIYRRIDLKDAALAHINALFACEKRGFGRYVISATKPFQRQHLVALRINPSVVVAARFPDSTVIYGAAAYRMFSNIDWVYVSHRARQALDWVPQYDFGRVLTQIRDGGPIRGALARKVGARGYRSKIRTWPLSGVIDSAVCRASGASVRRPDLNHSKAAAGLCRAIRKLARFPARQRSL